MPQIVITDFLTHAQIKQCVRLWNHGKGSLTGYARQICEEIIQPNLAEINEKLGQENSPMYLAYAIEYVMMKGVK